MKRLQRYTMVGTDHGHTQLDATGPWVRHDDALEALNDRQAVIDVITAQKTRLQVCVEVADRMRAFLGEFLTQRGVSVETDDEADTIAKLYDQARAISMGDRLRKPAAKSEA